MIKKILVPLDGSKFAEKALPYAENLARRYQAELILVRSLQPMVIVSEPAKTVFYRPRLIHDRNEAGVYLSSVERKLHLPTRTAVLTGHPVAEAIVDAAAQEAVNLIVMATHARSGFKRWLAGSVADEVLQRAPCPVFLVRDPQSIGSYKN